MDRGWDSSRPFYECFAAVAVDRHHRCISEKSSEFHGVSDSFPSTGIILTAVVFWLIKTKGLNLLSVPSNDLVASSALAAAGCQIVLFTTGRGTPFGTFVPTAKISTNSTLAANKPLWIDFNAGEIVDGRPSEDVDAAFVDFVLGVASGEMTNNEKSGYSEIAIFKSGVTL